MNYVISLNNNITLKQLNYIDIRKLEVSTLNVTQIQKVLNKTEKKHDLIFPASLFLKN